MANLRVAMDAAFYDLNLSSTQTLESTVKFVPDEPPPIPTARASRTLRRHQLSFFKNAFPLGIIPSFSPTNQKELGSFSLQSLLFGPTASNWWGGLVGQFRPIKMISNIKKELMTGDEMDLPEFKDVAKHIVDKSLYALGAFSQVSLTDDTCLLLNVERHGERKGRRTKVALHHRLPDHDVSLEAAWPEIFLDQKGTYWQVPSSASINISSLISPSGLRYRFGLHRNSGSPESLNSSSDDVPTSLMPGICAKAAFSYEKSKDFWRERVKKNEDNLEKEPARLPSYDVQLQEPHSAVSGIFGGTCAAWFSGNEKIGSKLKRRHPFTADLFGSIGYTIQHGKFQKDFNDLTRLDARLDIASASSFVKGTCYLVSDLFKGRRDREVNPLASPKLNITLQQQVAGPIVFRVDSKVSMSSPAGKHVPHLDDVIYALSYSLRLLESGKILAWYSPKRKEAVVELRVFDF